MLREINIQWNLQKAFVLNVKQILKSQKVIVA